MDLAGSDMERFGDFSEKALALYTQLAEPEATATATAAAPAAPAPVPPAPPAVPELVRASSLTGASVWDLLAAEERAGRIRDTLITWGDLRRQPFAHAFHRELQSFVADHAGMAFPTISPRFFVTCVSTGIDTLSIDRTAPLLPFLIFVHHSTVGSAHHSTLGALARTHYAALDGAPQCAMPEYPAIGLTARVFSAAFGTTLRPDGTRVVRGWMCANAVARYAAHKGITQLRLPKTGRCIGAASTDANATAPGRVLPAAPERPLPTEAEWRALVARISGALHRLAVAFAGSSGGSGGGGRVGPNEGGVLEVSLQTVASASADALGLVEDAVRKARAVASESIQRICAHIDDASAPRNEQTALPPIGRLKDAWHRAHVVQHVRALRARAVQTDGVGPIDDSGAEAARVAELRAEIMPLMTAIRGRALVNTANAWLSAITDPMHSALTSMMAGSNAIAARINDCVGDAAQALENATERSTLTKRIHEMDGVGRPYAEAMARSAVDNPTRQVPLLSAALAKLALCHPFVLSDELIDAIAGAIHPTRFEREMFTELWAAFNRIAERMLECMRASVFSAADAKLLDAPSRAVPLPPRAARAAAQLDAFVRECVARCRAAAAATATTAAPATTDTTAPHATVTAEI